MVKRRTFIGGVAGSLVSLSLAAEAQPSSMPAIGFIRSTPAEPFAHLVVAFRKGLLEVGFVEGQNVTIEQRWADNQPGRLPVLAGDLVRRRVAAIVGNGIAVEAAMAVTTTIPIVFVTSDDPVKRGFVASLSRPGGNVTGVTFFGGGQLESKRLELLTELVPKASVVAFLLDPNSPSAAELPDVEASAVSLGRRVFVVKAASARELEPAFAAIAKAGAGAMMVGGSPVFTSQRQRLVALAMQHRIPAIYDVRDHVDAGGLISFAASFTDAYRQAGVYAGRILKGSKPSELPVLQPTSFELVINLKTAKALGITVPQSMLLRADEVLR